MSEHTSTPKTFDDYLRAAQAKDAASMAELASLFALEKSECVAALVQIARGRTDCGARFVAGTFARIQTVLAPGEDRADVVREAVERELKRRERIGQKPPPKSDPEP